MTDNILIKSTDLVGRAVHDRKGGKLATIREVFIDKLTGRVQFVILDTGGLFGGGGKFHPLPWRLLHFDPAADLYATAVTKDQLKQAPAYDRDQLNSTAYGWGDQIDQFFGNEAGPAA
jgi:sporulation protein YlmC with PRC-barrel domain